MCLAQIKVLHRRPGNSNKERTRLFKLLTKDEQHEAQLDAVENRKSLVPFGGN